ncbi:MAG: proteasome assembly chaperone family protein [Candidatus Lokiarchaeota archaeon]|nr:proteasome assembly chaperone family protein [Candidatus Lokiarchaeota archaeon]
MVVKEYICESGKKSKVVIEDFSTNIKEDVTILLCFAGIGLIGPIIANTLIKQIPDIKEIGFITSEYLPPISVFYSGVLKNPFRVYYSPKNNIIVGICEVPFDISSAYNDLARTISNWALNDDVQAKQIVIFQGIPQAGVIDDFSVYYAAEAELVDFLEQYGIKKFDRGIIIGPESTILNETLSNKLQGYALFAPVYQIPTPEAAASIITVLNDIYGLDIEISKLMEEGKEIKQKMLELAEKTQEFSRKQLSKQGSEGAYTQYYR